MSAAESRNQLNDYFASELDGLRTRAIEFAQENPSIAEELMLNQHHDGKSRDPHVEVLIQSFAWLTSRLRQNIESESAKLPSMLLQQLYPQLICSTPSMAIAEFNVNGFKANFDNGYLMAGRQTLEPIGVTGNKKLVNKLQQCKFSSCYDTVLWPLQTKQVSREALNDFPLVARRFNNGQAAVKINVAETDKGAAKSTRFNRPLRFFIDLEEQHRFKFYDYLSRHFVGAVVLGPDQEELAVLSADKLRVCGFADNERLFPGDNHQDLGFSLLHDYFSFPEKFMFFELSGLQKVQVKSDLQILLVFDENLANSVELGKQSLKLNCAPVINLFNKTSEPLPIHYKDYRYKLYPSRENYDCFEIIKVNKLYSVNKQGETNELKPYFSLGQKQSTSSGFRWLVQQENSHRKQLSGTDAWLSLFDVEFANSSPVGETLYAETWCCNRSVPELFNKSQKFSVVGSSPVSGVKLLTRPTRHRGSQLNKEHLWKLLSHLSVYYVSLCDPELAQQTLIRFLSLYANKENPITQRQIESIEKLEAFDDIQPVQNDGWRGYYNGTHFILTLTERKFDGSSPLLFGRVIQQFLALFCHINSFVRLELKLGNRSLYQWQPMSGHQMLI